MKNPIKEALDEGRRDRQIIRVFYKYGFGAFLRRIKGESLLKKALSKNGNIEKYISLSRGVRLRKALEELGPTFVKLGQILSTRSDLLPLDMTEELKKLQDDVEVFSFKEAKRIFEEETQLDMLEEFFDLDIKPIAAASIGQVYKARTKGSERVVIKIQRPDIEETIRLDLKILRRLSKLIDGTINKGRPMKFEDVVEEFGYYLERELDYIYEAQNAYNFYKNFKDSKEVLIPKIHWNYTTKRVIVMEEMRGIKVDDVERIEKMGWSRQKIAENLAAVFLKQVLVDGLFHGDPHPGNILVKSEDCISLIDFGIAGYLDDSLKQFILIMVKSIKTKKTDKIAEALMDLNPDVYDLDEETLKKDVHSIMSYYTEMPWDKVDLSSMLNDLIKLSHKYSLKIPSQLTLLLKAVVVMQGTLAVLEPSFSIAQITGRFLSEFYKKGLGSLHVKAIASEIADLFIDGYVNTRGLPRKVRRIVDNIVRNKAAINVSLDYTEMSKSITARLAKKISFSIVLSGLLIASTMLLNGSFVQESLIGRYLGMASMGSAFLLANVYVWRYVLRRK